jgi:hypothetical protein
MLQGKGIRRIEYKEVRRTEALYSANIDGDHILYIQVLFSPSPEEYQLSFKQNVQKAMKEMGCFLYIVSNVFLGYWPSDIKVGTLNMYVQSTHLYTLLMFYLKRESLIEYKNVTKIQAMYVNQ